MRSMLHALVWHSFKYAGGLHVFMLAICLLPLFVFASFAAIDTSHQLQAGDPVMLLLEISLMPFVIFMLSLSVAVHYAETGKLYTKPISNLSLASWRIVGGSVLIAIEVGGVICIYNGLYHVGWPLLGAVLFSVAFWLVCQPFLILSARSFWNALITLVPIVLMGAWLLFRYKPPGGRAYDWNQITGFEVVQLLTVTGLFAWLTLRSIEKARCGESLALPLWLKELGQLIERLPVSFARKDRAFRSAQRALFWYEWRWKGLALVLAMLFLLVAIVPVSLMQSFSLSSFHTAIIGAYVSCIVPACVLSIFNGFHFEALKLSGSSHSTENRTVDQLGSFHATRPVTDAALARATLLACLGSVATTLGLWLVLAVPTWVIAAAFGKFNALLSESEVVAVPFITLTMWIMISNGISLISTGRTKFIGGLVIAGTAVVVTLLAGLEWIGQLWLQQLVGTAFLITLGIGIAVVSVWAFRRALAYKYLSRGEVVLAAIVAIAIPLVSLTLLERLKLEMTFMLLAAGLLAVLPWATTPLAIRLNRHR